MIPLPDLPLLTAEQERELARRRDAGDQRAKDKLVEHNLRLVASVCLKYKGRGVAYEDLFQEGCIGLTRAAELFEWQRGHRFSTYATWWIKQAVAKAVDRGGTVIRTPPAVGAARRRLFAAAERLREELGREPTTQELADGAGCTVAVAKRALRAARASVSLHATDNEGRELIRRFADSYTVDPEAELERVELVESVEAALDVLDDSERRAVEALMNDDHDVALAAGLTAEGAELHLASGLDKLRGELLHTAA